MIPEERLEDWLIYCGGDSAAYSKFSKDIEVDFDSDGLSVRIEDGTGYGRMYCRGLIPLKVILRMMENAGYRIEVPEGHAITNR